MQPLQFYYRDLKKKFKNELRSEWMVCKDGKKFLGFSIDSNPILADVEIENIKKIVGNDYKIVYQPNNDKIYIE